MNSANLFAASSLLELGLPFLLPLKFTQGQYVYTYFSEGNLVQIFEVDLKKEWLSWIMDWAEKR